MNEQEMRQTPSEGGGGGYLSEIIKGVLALPDNEPTNNISAPPSPESTVTHDQRGDLASLLLSNPTLLEKLPSLISLAKPLIGLLSTPSSKIGTSDETAVQPASAINTSGSSPTKAVGAFETTKESNPSAKHNESDCRAALLCAMKPYLSADRRDAIDYIIKLSRLGDLLKSL